MYIVSSAYALLRLKWIPIQPILINEYNQTNWIVQLIVDNFTTLLDIKL